MAYQTDVKATKVLSSTGAFVDQANANITYRVRIKGIYAINGATAGTVAIASGSETVATIATPANTVAGNTYILLPGEGILAESGISATITNTTSVIVFYG